MFMQELLDKLIKESGKERTYILRWLSARGNVNKIKQKQIFKYLESVLIVDEICDAEIRRRIGILKMSSKS